MLSFPVPYSPLLSSTASPFSEKIDEYPFLQAAISTAETCEIKIKMLLDRSPPFSWDPLNQGYHTRTKAYRTLKDYDKAIEYSVQKAFNEIRMARYASAAQAFNTACKIISVLPSSSQFFPPCSLIALLSQQLPHLLSSDMHVDIRPLLKSIALLYHILKAYKHSSIYFAWLAECHLQKNNLQEAGASFYAAGIQIHPSVQDSSYPLQAIALFKKAAEIQILGHHWSKSRRSLKGAIKHYTALNCTQEIAACWEKIAEQYCLLSPEKEAKYLHCAFNIYEEQKEIYHMAICLKKLALCYQKLGNFWMVAVNFYQAGMQYIALDNPLIAIEYLTKAAFHYRDLVPPQWEKAIECLKLSANLCMEQNLFQEAGKYSRWAAQAAREDKKFLLAANSFAAAAEHFIKEALYDEAINCLENAGKFYSATDEYSVAAQAFEKAAFFCQVTSQKHKLSYFFYFAAEYFALAAEYSKAEICYIEVIQWRQFVKENSFTQQYDTAWRKACHCHRKIYPKKGILPIV